MACGSYKEYTVNYCPDAFVFSGYGPQVYVEWQLSNITTGEKVKGEAVTNSAGVLNLPVNGTVGLTKDQFQHFTGVWEFRSNGVDSVGNIFPFVFCDASVPYDFVVFNFQYNATLPVPNNVNVAFSVCAEA